jgi:hypothetical protein
VPPYNRILVARAGRSLPAIVDAVRSGQVHLAGLRLLVPHLTSQNHREVLAQAAGKSKREIVELVARLAPQPPVPTVIRKLPQQRPPPAFVALPTLALEVPATPPPQREEARHVVAPLSEETFKVQFTASRTLKDKLRQAQDLLRHRVPEGDLATIVEKALDVLIEKTKKERFATGRKPRQLPAKECDKATTRHIPDAIRRAVFERDRGRCTFTDERGRRCAETGALEFDHLDGFALTQVHDIDRIRLLCRAHNQYAAEQIYGRAFMEQVRSSRDSTCPGTSPQPRLL